MVIMGEEIIQLKWKRPNSVEYPKVWHRFMARDLNSDSLIEYRIEDLVESRAEDAYKHMRENFLVDQPISQAMGGYDDNEFYQDFCYGWRSIMAQKMPLVCYRDGSDEIVGLHWIFVKNKADQFGEKHLAKAKSRISIVEFGIESMLYEHFDVFEHYGVEEYMASFGLSVDKKYRGRRIGDQFLATREIVCKEFGIKLSHTMFSSDYSNQNAENVGFETNAEISYEEVRRRRPDFQLPPIKSHGMTVKSKLY